MRDRITLFYVPDDIPLQNTLYPFVTSRHRRRFRFVTNPDDALNTGDSDVLVMLRFFKYRRRHASGTELLSKLRNSYRRVVFLDDRAGTGALDSEALAMCDLYYKKQLYRDRSLYTRPIAAGRLFVQQYVDTIGLSVSEPAESLSDTKDLHKLRLFWNLGIGSYPKTRLRKRVIRLIHRKLGPNTLRFAYGNPERIHGRANPRGSVSARFATNLDNTGVAYHRQLLYQAAAADPRFLTGKLPLAQYNRELRSTAATLSPFGYGEVCFRDFEAILSDSVLLKPDMSHVDTWPNVYQPHRTYVPCRWDGSDISSAADRVLSDPVFAGEISRNARSVLNDAYLQLENRVEQFIDTVLA